MSSAVVYWIRFEEHTDPYTEGYIGVTTNFRNRIKRHKKEVELRIHANEHLTENLENENIRIDVLHEAEEEACYDLEKQYRPERLIAWNIAAGGAEGGCKRTGYTLSEKFKEKRRIYMRGNKFASYNKNKKSEEHKRKIAESLRGKNKSEEQKKKQSVVMSGRTLSEEHKEKIRLAALGKKRGPYRRKSNVAL